MALDTRADVRNVALVAHVDHGKSTIIDALLWQLGEVREHGSDAATLLRAYDPQRAKSIAVVPKITSLRHPSGLVNVLDVPGHAAFGREAERTLRMVEGLLLVVDAAEGPVPQTRIVVRRALEDGLAPLILINKIDRDGARPLAVLEEVREMLADLDATEAQRACPARFAVASRGVLRRAPDGPDEPLLALLDDLRGAVPAPAFDPESPFRMWVAHLGYDDYLGRLAVGRVHHGVLRPGQPLVRCVEGGEPVAVRPAGLYGWDGTRRVELEEARAGDIVALAGIDAVAIGDTLADPSRAVAIVGTPREEPTIAVEIEVSDSPFAGQEGSRVRPEDLRERLWQEILTNPALAIEHTDDPRVFRILARNELQLVMLLEVLRREGFEVNVGPPAVRFRTSAEGGPEQPIEALVIDCPEPYAAVVTQKVEARGGRMTRMVNHGRGRVRIEFRIPSAGLLGYRAEFLADTRRAGILHHAFDGWAEGAPQVPRRTTGALIADRPGRASTWALEGLQSRGALFVSPGDPVYEGMIVGENSQAHDVRVHVGKERPATDGPRSAEVATHALVPARSLSVEQALELLRDDEMIELGPRSLRLRKRVLRVPGA